MNVGDVARVWASIANKTKIVLFVGTEYSLFLWFNSDPRRERPAQMRVAPGEAPGISRDCFLNCGQVYVFSEDELARAEICGRTSPAFLLRVVDEIEARATTLVTAHRKAIAAALRQAARL